MAGCGRLPGVRKGAFLAAVVVATLAVAVPTARAVVPGSPGDATCDGALDLADSLRFMEIAAGLANEPPCDLASADADGDLIPGVGDAVAVRRWVAGLPVRPRLLSISPANLAAGSAASEVVVFGGFLGANTVLRWHGTDIAMEVADDGSVGVALVPASLLGSAGLHNVQVVTPGVHPSETLLYEVLTPIGCAPAAGVVATLSVQKLTPEIATITLSEPRNMGGWKLISEAGPQQYTFPAGYVYNPALGDLRVWSAVPAFPSTATHLWWRVGSVWNNMTKDDGRLEDCQGNVVATWVDPSPPPD